MLSERLVSQAVRLGMAQCLKLDPWEGTRIPGPQPGKRYMLYAHVPFCERLCPYCSFNRFPFSEGRARPYFDALRREMRMLADQGYDFYSLYIGGGTPTIMLDELCATIDLAHELFSIKEVSSETNPNHLIPEYLDALDGRIHRLSVGVQSFDDGLLRQMERYQKYGSAQEIFQRVQAAAPYFKSLNVDMIFNFPAQTEDMLINDLAHILECGAGQTTFYPLMASPSVERSLAATVGAVDYSREQRFYEIICEALLGAGYTMGSAWTFNRYAQDMIDEYVVDGEDYPAIGSGGFGYLDGALYVNTFSLADYARALDSGRLSVMGRHVFGKRDRMRYRFMMQLFALRLDKRQFKRDFGCSVEAGLPAEMAFMRAAGAFDRDDDAEITLTPKGRYLTVAMMRQFFIGVNSLRDMARNALTGEEHDLLFGEAGALRTASGAKVG